jgi:hypothetical protein
MALLDILKGKNHRKTTKQDSLSLAREIAEDWCLVLRGKDRADLLKTGKTFRQGHRPSMRSSPRASAPRAGPSM